MNSFYLAWRYIRFHKWKTCLMIGCIFLTAVLPITFHRLFRSFESGIYARSVTTPVVVGAEGSQLDLVLQTLYFNRSYEKSISFSETKFASADGLAQAIPIHTQYTARRRPIVGTTMAYFRFRNLEIATGAPLSILGDCVIGSDVARDLKIGVGDGLLSDRKNLLDLAGDYPLKMKVVGVLKRSGTPDDRAIFVDLKTAWVIQGLGHGHQDLEAAEQDDNVVRKSDRIVAIPSKVVPYTEITDANLGSFHFHGDLSDFPITAMIVAPKDVKSRDLLENRYRGTDRGVQFVRPVEAIESLMASLFKIRQFFLANTSLVAIATGLLTGLVVLLSLKLRQDEMDTMFKIGCQRSTIIAIQLAEMFFIFSTAGLLVIAVALGASHWIEQYLNQWITGG